MKILFVGNSYTFFSDMPLLFEGLCKENGKDVEVYSVTKGGRKLYENIDNDDECSKELRKTLKENHFDFCIIQENSTLPVADFEKFEYGLTELVKLAKESVDNFVLYETWGRKTGNKMLEELGLTNESMTKALYEAYKKMGEKLGCEVSHVGLNFYYIYTSDAEVDIYDKDLTHPSYEGSCLAALTHFEKIFGEFPTNIKSLNLEDNIVSAFKEAVLKNGVKI